MKRTRTGRAHSQNESTDSMLKVVLDACGDAIEENLPDCGFIVILAETGEGDSGTMRYLSNLTKESRDHLLTTILSGEEPPPPGSPPPTVQ